MKQNNRDGQRKRREQFLKKRIPELGYYIVIVDTKETEKNYIHGLRDTIPEKLRRKLVIKVSQIKTALLVEEAVNLAAGQAQYCEPWILLDKDQNLEFNLIIKKADKNNKCCMVKSMH